MARIILIETSTALCSVALAEDGRIVAYKESETPRAQASLTAPFVKDILDAQGLGVRDCDAVCRALTPAFAWASQPPRDSASERASR